MDLDDVPLIEILIVVMTFAVLGFAGCDALFTPKQARWLSPPQETCWPSAVGQECQKRGP